MTNKAELEQTLGNLFAADEAAALEKYRAERAAENADPALLAKLRAEALARSARLEAEFDAAVASGQMTPDGEYIEEDEEDEDEDEDEDGTIEIEGGAL